MADTQPDLEIQDDSLEETPGEDKTSEKNEENTLDDLPSEDDLDLSGKEELGEKNKKVVDKAEIAQKIKWRGKAKSLETEVTRLIGELKKSQNRVQDEGGNIDEKERAAQQYIKDQAKKVYQELRDLEKQEEERTVRDFEDKVEEVLEDNPGFTEDELLNVIEELEVDPATAMKVLKRNQEKGSKQKPKMPKNRRASAEVSKEEVKKPGERKGFWQIAQDVRKQIKDLRP